MKRRVKKQAARKAQPGAATKPSHEARRATKKVFQWKMAAGDSLTVRNVRAKLGLSQPELSRVTGYSIRAIAGWERGKPLSDAARQKMLETERLRQALAKIIPPAQVGQWMRTPNSAFEGQTPIQVVERGESDRIWRMIWQIDAGVAS